MTSIPGVFSCGNVLHVHDLADWVSEESALAGQFAVQYLNGEISPPQKSIPILAGEGVRYVLPQSVSGRRDVTLSLRVASPSRNRVVKVNDGERLVANKKMLRLHPAEMIHIKVKAEKISEAGRLEVSVA
jgi:hypothetical protein